MMTRRRKKRKTKKNNDDDDDDKEYVYFGIDKIETRLDRMGRASRVDPGQREG